MSQEPRTAISETTNPHHPTRDESINPPHPGIAVPPSGAPDGVISADSSTDLQYGIDEDTGLEKNMQLRRASRVQGGSVQQEEVEGNESYRIDR